MLHLVLIRGLPGSGKSTRAKREYPNFVHIENDMFLMEDGQYVFTDKRRKNAVKACIEATENALKQGKSVVVSNCFLRHESMLPYTWLAKQYGADVDVQVATGNFPSIHNVPEDVIDSMRKQFQP